MACIAASIPDSVPEQVWSDPAAIWISDLSKRVTDFAAILRSTSPIPIGLISGYIDPGFLSNGMNRLTLCYEILGRACASKSEH